MNFFKDVLIDSMIEISLHILEDQVNIPFIFGNKDLMKLYNLFMFDLFQNGNFSKSSLSISGMLESFENLFEGIYFFRGFLDNFPYMSICSRS